jgi:hypothetical protein
VQRDATYRDIPGHTLWNPHGAEEPTWEITVESVTEPDEDGFVVITAVEGEVKVCSDMNWYSLHSPRCLRQDYP